MKAFDFPLRPPRFMVVLQALLLAGLLASGLLVAIGLRSHGHSSAAAIVLAIAALLVIVQGTRSVRGFRHRDAGLLHVDASGRASWRIGGHAFRCRVEKWRIGTQAVALSLRVTDAVDAAGTGDRRACRRIDLVSGPGRTDDEAFRRMRAWLNWMSRGAGGPDGPA